MKSTAEKIYELVRNLPDYEQLVVLDLAKYLTASQRSFVDEDARAAADSVGVTHSHSWGTTWSEGESRAFSDPTKKFEF